GNRTSTTSGGATTTLAYNSVDELTGDGAINYAYDANGSTTRINNASGQTIYGYNARNQLVTVVAPDGSTTSSTYDADGNRVQTHSGASTVNYLVDSTSKIP